MEHAREIRARRELAQELGTWSYVGTLGRCHDIDSVTWSDDVQKFEKAIVSGKPFKTESVRRRVPKTNMDDANETSDPGSSSSSDPELPKVVSVNMTPTPPYADSVRTMHGGVSWRSSRIRARTMTDSVHRVIP
jgi:hypothetical protein